MNTSENNKRTITQTEPITGSGVTERTPGQNVGVEATAIRMDLVPSVNTNDQI